MKSIIKKLLREGLIGEDIDDLPRHLTDKSYITKIANKLGYELTSYLDSGNNGSAYTLKGNKVLKITTDKTEFLVATKLKGKKLNRVSEIYNTYKINNLDVYIIVLELLEPLPEDLFLIIEEYNGTNIKNKTSHKFDWLRNELNEIINELKSSGISNPTDVDWWMNMGIKNGKLSVFDVGDTTIDYTNFESIDLDNI